MRSIIPVQCFGDAAVLVTVYALLRFFIVEASLRPQRLERGTTCVYTL
jgi:hypothetical protein